MALILALGFTGPPDRPVRPIVFASRATVHRSVVQLSDIANLASLPAALKDRVASLALFQMAPGSTRVVKAQSLARRVRAIAPALGPWLQQIAGGQIQIDYERAATAQKAPSCFRAMQPLPAGAFPVADDFVPADCEPGSEAALSYDTQTGLVRASRDLTQGELLASVPAFAVSAVRPGQRVYLETVVGPVKVSRAFQVVRPARAEQSFFAKSQDGLVVTLPPVEDAQ